MFQTYKLWPDGTKHADDLRCNLWSTTECCERQLHLPEQRVSLRNSFFNPKVKKMRPVANRATYRWIVVIGRWILGLHALFLRAARLDRLRHVVVPGPVNTTAFELQNTKLNEFSFRSSGRDALVFVFIIRTGVHDNWFFFYNHNPTESVEVQPKLCGTSLQNALPQPSFSFSHGNCRGPC